MFSQSQCFGWEYLSAPVLPPSVHEQGGAGERAAEIWIISISPIWPHSIYKYMDMLVNLTRNFSSRHLTDVAYRTRLCARLVTHPSQWSLISWFSVQAVGSYLLAFFIGAVELFFFFEEAAFLWPRTTTPDLATS